MSQTPTIEVVRKRIKRRENQSRERYDEAFQKEQACLQLIERLEHPNIISLFAAYTYRAEHFFLFPAYQIDLRDFLQSPDRFQDFRYDFTFFSALKGLASALLNVHNLHLDESKHGVDLDMIGYHHDLRPANVLVSRDTFILADFGLGKFKSGDSDSHTEWKCGAGDYLAPECMGEEFGHQRVDRAIDVWAFGCLSVEVVSYMTEGVEGLNKFRESRLIAGRYPNWKDTCFHNGNNGLKSVVQEWLARLAGNTLPTNSVVSVVEVAKEALKVQPSERQRMTYVFANLSQISIQALFNSTLQAFQECAEQATATQMATGPPIAMKMWYEGERLTAFGHNLSAFIINPMDEDTLNAAQRFENICDILKALYRRLESLLTPSTKSREIPPTKSSICTRSFYRERVYSLIESLWTLLPPLHRREAERHWLQSLLNTDNVTSLCNVQRALKIEKGSIYDKGAAMASMRQIRLEIESGSATFPYELIIAKEHLRSWEDSSGHFLGILNDRTKIFVERMSYSPGWEKVPPEQQLLSLSRKAKGFSEELSSGAQMKMLHCLGVFEETNGFGFAYQIPEASSKSRENFSIITLLQLLSSPSRDERTKRRPLLGEKFRLAFVVAQFLWEFHSIGWLHENFNSHNIVFFGCQPDDPQQRIIPSQDLSNPFIVGLHKSRPGGKSWYTVGPISGGSFQDYQHPDYAQTGRFKAIYDQYSLGLILLEIGFWRPLQTWSGSPACQKMNLEQFRHLLLERTVPNLGIEMGATYRNIVRFCLDAPAHSGEDLDKRTINSFAENVVRPLREMAESSI